MKFNKLILSMLLLVASLGFSSSDAFDFDKAWKEVDEALSKGLPKTALSKINEIYTFAIKEGNTEEQIKATMSEAKLTLDTEELGLEKVVSTLNIRTQEAKSPTKQLLHSLTADLFKSYYQNQYYKISQRTNLVSFDTGDMRTWAPNNYRDFISNQYLSSISDDTQLFKTKDYTKLLSRETADIALRPSLYDLLVDKALSYFSQRDFNTINSSFDFELDDKKYFSRVDSFVNIEITKDDNSKINQAIRLFQDQIKRQIILNDTKVLTSYDMKRMDFVMSVGNMRDKKELYENGLKEAITYYQGDNSHSFIIKLAQSYVNTHRYDEALTLLDKLVDGELYINAQKQNLINSIHRKQLSIVSEKVIPRNTNFLLNVTSRNLDRVYFKLLKVKEENFTEILSNDRNTQFEKINVLPVIKSWERSGVKTGYKSSSYEEIIDGLEYGRYIIISSNEADFSIDNSAYQYTAFYVSDLAYNTYQDLNSMRMFVRNRSTGVPECDVKIEIMTRVYNSQIRKNEIKKIQTENTDKKGWVNINLKGNSSYLYRLSNGDDVLYLDEYDYSQRIRESDYTNERTEIFTDRAIYRPGQTVHFKTISLDVSKDGIPNLKADRKVNVVLSDVNGQEVSKLDLVTNEYGSASGSFVLPIGRLTGNFSLKANGTYHGFKVEEYKRPKFEVEINELDDEVSLGDIVSISGVAKALSGSPTSNAKVKYKVMRQTYYGWWSWYRRVPSSTEIIKQGELVTDENGKYNLDFLAEPDSDMIKANNPTYSYVIDVDVTDLSGETRSAQKIISVSALPYAYTMNLPEITDVKDLKIINVKATTSNGVNLSSKAKLIVTELQQPEQWEKPRTWDIPSHYVYKKEDFEGRIDRRSHESKSQLSDYPEKQKIHEAVIDITEEGIDLNLSKYIVGGKAYKIELVSDEAYEGIHITQTQYLAATDFKNSIFPVVDLLYVNPLSEIATVGDDYRVQLGTSDKELTVYYYIVRDREIIYSGVADVDNNYTIKYQPSELDRGGVTLYIDYVKHSYYNGISKKIELPWDHKKLEVQLITKRDKVLPGSKEEWLLKISGKDKDKTIAEVLATMYDASLDQFVGHEYLFNPYVNHYGHINSRAFGFNNGKSGQLNYKWNRKKTDRVDYPVIPVLKLLSYGYRSANPLIMARSSMKKSRRSGGEEPIMEADAVMSTMVDDVASSSSSNYEGETQSSGLNAKEKPIVNGENKQISIRKNLDESVFFYPHLKTDADGNLLISFTMNEALTTWKLLTLAHDKELRYGMTSHEVKTQKDVMILPNVPRFLREGDRLIFPATVSNLSSDDITAKARLELIDPETDLEINDLFGLSNSEKSVFVTKGVSERVDWEVVIPDNYKKLVKYRVTVSSGTHTDGEENILPVITNQILVTETKVISVKGKEHKRINFEALSKSSNTSEPYRYTFEYTSHPIWYAVQALPYLMEYPHQCTEQIFNRMYANTLASHIANSTPKIKSVFDQWKTLDSDALLSNLEKNPELKSAILEETPWVRSAKSETEQKKRIALLFDLNKMAVETSAVIDELAKRQMSNGAFPWFAGGRENVYITQNILEGMAHLQHLGVLSKDDQRVSQIQKRALKFLDDKTSERYKKLKQSISKYGGDMDKDHLDRLSIHYLYVRSFFDGQDVSKSAKEAYNYYLEQSKKYWLGNGLYLESMIGLTLYRNDAKEYSAIQKSLKERSFYSEDLGRYWNIGNGFSWHELPIESHSMLIEFFTAVESDKSFIEDMKIWLLKNKQTNHWKTTKATASAIYALLIKGESTGVIPWLEEEQGSDIKIGGTVINQSISSRETGTGYFKKSWHGEEITSDLGEIEISNNNESITWGASYYQYFEDLDKVDGFDEAPLEISRKLFKEEMTNNGSQLLSLDDVAVTPGDRIIVRIEIKVDRNMSYVHLKDMRGSGFEPENVLSGYRWKGGLGYYESTRDVASHFFISQLNKGTYVFEYPVRVVHKGDFSSGIASIQCMYAPEFTSHSEGGRVEVE